MALKISTIIIFVFLFSLPKLFSQELDVNVTVDMKQLSQEARVNVQTMESDIERYLNNQQFIKTEWEGPKIPVEISIYLQGGGRGNYSARMFIVSKRTLDIKDGSASIALRLVEDKWSFEYARFSTLTYNPLRFDRFTSILDYYMLLIIGMDLDTYGELDGSNAYEQAKQIVLLGAAKDADGFSTYSMPGEFTKYNLVSELTDLRYEELRKLIFAYYYDGLDMMLEDKKQGLDNLREVITKFVKYKKYKMVGPSVFLQAFFDAKHQELAQIFRNYSDKQVYRELMYLDPTHSTVYEDAMEN